MNSSFSFPNDEPASVDLLDRSHYASAIADVVTTCQPPFSLAVFGTWGIGKTSLLNLVDAELASNEDVYPVWFFPWKHQFDEHPIVGLLHAIARDVGLDADLEVQDWIAAVALAVSDRIPSIGLLPKPSDVVAHRRALESERFGRRSAQARLDGLLHALVVKALEKGTRRFEGHSVSFKDLSPRWQEGLKRTVPEKPSARRLVVFVDDLDRCTPEVAIKVLEALKIYLNHSSCVFVLALDRGPIEHAIASRASVLGGAGGDYLDKMIQFEFHIPRLDAQQSEMYLRALLGDLGVGTPSPKVTAGALDRAVEILLKADEQNPRELKRLASALAVQDRLARERVQPYYLEILAFLTVLQHRYRSVYRQIRRTPSRFSELFESVGSDAVVGPDHLSLVVADESSLGAACSALPERVRTVSVIDYLSLVSIGGPPEDRDEDEPVDLAVEGELEEERLARAGAAFLRRGQLAKAFERLTRAQEVSEAADSPDLARLLGLELQLSMLANDLSRPTDAKRFAHLVIEADGASRRDRLRAQCELARAESMLGEVEKAGREIQTVVNEQSQEFGARDRDTLTSLYTQAGIYRYQGNDAAAVELENEVLRTQRELLGPEHPDTLRTITQQMRGEARRGEASRANKVQRRVLETQRRTLGGEHTDTLTTLLDLALTDSALGRTWRARDVDRRLLRACRRAFGTFHPKSIETMLLLAQAYREAGELSTAKIVLQEVEALTRHALGPAAQLRQRGLAELESLGHRTTSEP